MSETKELTPAQPVNNLPTKAPVAVGDRGIQISDMDTLWRFASAVAKSGLAPKGIESPEAIFVAVQMGLEVGLSPMCALQNIAVINGRPSLWGDAVLGVVRGSGELEIFNEWYEDDGKKLTRNPSTFGDNVCAICFVKRRGYAPQEVSFSVADAKRAGLWGRGSVWTGYPARMLRMRARAFALRDSFGDFLRGIRTAEEAMDMPTVEAFPAPTFNEAPQLAAPEPQKTEPVDRPPAKPTGRKYKSVAELARAELPESIQKKIEAEPVAEAKSADTGAPAQPSTDATPQEKLAALLHTSDFTFGELLDLLCDRGELSDAGVEGFDTCNDIPAGLAEKLLSDPKTLLANLRFDRQARGKK